MPGSCSRGKADSARELLSTIASALLTITGLVFSITILVLQLASSQFSPRVLQTFLQDRSTQLSMGVFVGNFVYALVLLTQVRSEGLGHDEFVPAFSVAFAIALTLVSVAVLVRYIHHMAQSIRAVNVIGRVARDTRRCMDRIYPTTGAVESARVSQLEENRVADVLICNSEGPGVVLAVDEERLLQFASERDLVIALVPQTGAFVPAGSHLFRIFGNQSHGRRTHSFGGVHRARVRTDAAARHCLRVSTTGRHRRARAVSRDRTICPPRSRHSITSTTC